jgi:hypothetical protein
VGKPVLLHLVSLLLILARLLLILVPLLLILSPLLLILVPLLLILPSPDECLRLWANKTGTFDDDMEGEYHYY